MVFNLLRLRFWDCDTRLGDAPGFVFTRGAICDTISSSTTDQGTRLVFVFHQRRLRMRDTISRPSVLVVQRGRHLRLRDAFSSSITEQGTRWVFVFQPFTTCPMPFQEVPPHFPPRAPTCYPRDTTFCPSILDLLITGRVAHGILGFFALSSSAATAIRGAFSSRPAQSSQPDPA